ncbi:MAG: phospholipase D-like domain-containing protein [Kofleriaceae bacterium]
MRQPCSVALSLTLLAAAACGGGSQTGDDQPPSDAAPDAIEGIGCTPTSPRAVAPEAFVGPTGLQQRLTQLIDGAQRSLDVQMYLFTVSGLADRVIAAHQRGVAVRVLFDPDHDGNITTRNRLTSAGVPNRDAPSLYSFSHAKYLVIDGTTAVIMSMNFNIDAMNRERNYGIIDRDAEDVADLRAVFEMDWAAGGGEAPRPADLACTRLVVSPNNSKARILALIESATRKLDVEAIYVSEVTVRNAIAAAKDRGVAVRVILDGSPDNADTKTFFVGRGIPVHDASGFYNHAKLIIADGVAFVGSVNFSQTALTKNREIGALVFEPTPAAVIQQQFDTDWSSTN